MRLSPRIDQASCLHRSLAAGLMVPVAGSLQPHISRWHASVPSWAPRSSHRRPFSGPARSANQSVSASCGKDASSQAAAAVCIPRVANTAHAGQRNPPSTAYTCASAQDRHETQGWREKLLSSTAAAAVALAVAGMSVAAYPPPSIAAAAAAAEVGGFTEGPLDALQRQLRETDRALTRSLRKAQAAVADGIQAIAPPTRNVNGIMEVVQEQDRKAAQDAAELVWEVWDVVDREYMDARHTGFNHDAWAATRDAALKGALDSPAAAHKAVRLMMDRGLQDPYSRFISPQEFDTMKQYDMTGVGLNLGTAEEFHRKVGKPFPPGREDAKDGVWVIGIIQGSEAEREGLRQGDEVVALDGQPVSSLSPYQVSLAVAGEAEAGAAPPPHVQVRVRDSQGTLQQHSLTRTASVTQATVSTSVAKRPGGGRTGRIRISTFRNRTQVEVSKALQQCEKEGVTHLELDLRGNLGGLVSQGVETARLFLDKGATIVVKEEGQGGRVVTAATGPPVTRVPLTVLVDGDTASAAEILAGALRDNCRALLAGSRTYGKGLIQSIYELHDSSGLALTVGRYRTPAGTDIDQTGIVPDFRSPPSPEVTAARLRACTPPPPISDA